MSKIIPNSFSTYLHSPEEETHASLLSPLQEEGISNLLASAAESMLNLKVEDGKTLDFFVQQASLEGQIAAYKTILGNSQIAKESLEHFSSINEE